VPCGSSPAGAAGTARRHPEDPRASGDGPLGAEPRSRPARVSRRRALIWSSRGAAAAVVPPHRGGVSADPGGSFVAWRRGARL